MKYISCVSLMLIITATILTSCYRMPTEDDYSTVPVTNNPDVTREKPNFMPNMKY